MKKINYIIGSTTLGITHAVLLAFQQNSKISIYVSFILAAIASSSNTAIISEISLNTAQHDQSKTQGLLSAIIALAGCIGPVVLKMVPKIIPMNNHPTYVFLSGTIIYITQALILIINKSKTKAHQNTQSPLDKPLLQPLDLTNSDDIEN
jgi:hypothetical protein